MSTSTVTLRCASCGSETFERPAHPKASDKVTCAGCGATGTYGELMRKGKQQIVDEVAAKFRKLFK